MIEVLLLIFALFLAYLYLPTSGLNGFRSAKKTPTLATALPCPTPRTYVPEDAVLRRHLISQLRNEIEATLHPRPSDSILQRHYDALVSMTLEQRLVELGRLQPC